MNLNLLLLLKRVFVKYAYIVWLDCFAVYFYKIILEDNYVLWNFLKS